MMTNEMMQRLVTGAGDRYRGSKADTRRFLVHTVRNGAPEVRYGWGRL